VGNDGVNQIDSVGLCPLGPAPGKCKGLKLREEGVDNIRKGMGVKIEKSSSKNWSATWHKKVIREGHSKTPEHRESLIAHELVAIWHHRHGIPEHSFIDDSFTETTKGNLASGTHNLALAFELAKLAESDPGQCPCEYAKKRLLTADVAKDPTKKIFWKNEVHEIVKFICDCQNGKIDGAKHHKIKESTFGFFDEEALRVEYMLKCNGKKIKACTSIAWYD
jgi:hypothetical protein